MINIDFLVAGCSTRCRHCYVNGGPGPMMPVEDALLCIEKLDDLASYLPEDTSFTLDHEPMNHPQLPRILSAASRTRHIQNYHHGMTSGVGLMGRKDRESLLRAYLDCGYGSLGITLHGSAEHHDEIVRRRGAHDTSVAAAAFAKAQGLKVDVSLMLNRFFAADAEDLSQVLEQLQPDSIYFALPIFVPHRNALDFEPFRASLQTLESLQGYLSRWHQNAQLIDTANQSTPAAAAERLRQGTDLRALFAQAQDEQYLTLHQDCKLYIGNSGAETRCLGDLRTMDLRAAAEQIQSLPGNRDYGAYYDVDALPASGGLVQALESLPPNLIYGDFASAVYRGLAELDTPTKILN